MGRSSRRSLAAMLGVAVTAFATAALAQSTTVVLQNSLNGYTGFQDTYLENAVAQTVHGEDTLLKTYCG